MLSGDFKDNQCIVTNCVDSLMTFLDYIN